MVWDKNQIGSWLQKEHWWTFDLGIPKYFYLGMVSSLSILCSILCVFSSWWLLMVMAKYERAVNFSDVCTASKAITLYNHNFCDNENDWAHCECSSAVKEAKILSKFRETSLQRWQGFKDWVHYNDDNWVKGFWVHRRSMNLVILCFSRKYKYELLLPVSQSPGLLSGRQGLPYH